MQESLPALPGLVAGLGSRLPVAPLSMLLDVVLARTFASVIDEGELDFLDGREVAICVNDAGVRLAFTLRGGRLRSGTPRDSDVAISGNAAAFALLAAKRVDADTLFFQRTLVMHGDTELGLAVKYLLEAMPLDALPRVLRTALERIADTLQPDAVIPAVPRQ